MEVWEKTARSNDVCERTSASRMQNVGLHQRLKQLMMTTTTTTMMMMMMMMML